MKKTLVVLVVAVMVIGVAHAGTIILAESMSAEYVEKTALVIPAKVFFTKMPMQADLWAGNQGTSMISIVKGKTEISLSLESLSD